MLAEGKGSLASVQVVFSRKIGILVEIEVFANFYRRHITLRARGHQNNSGSFAPVSGAKTTAGAFGV